MKKILPFLFLLIPSLAIAADLKSTTIASAPFSLHASNVFETHSIASTTDSIEWIFQCEEPDTITDLGFLYDQGSGTPCAQVISLEGVSSTGRADGSIKSSGNAIATYTPPADTSIDGLWQWKTLTSSYACTRGEFLAIKIADVSDGCTPAAGTAESAYFYRQNNTWPGQNFPHSWTIVTGTPTARNGMPVYGYKSATRAYGIPIETQTNQGFGQDTTPDEYGNSFSIPSGSCDTFKVNGAVINGYLDCGGSTATVALYSGTTALQNVTIDCDVWSSPASLNVLKVIFDEASLTDLTCGSTYRIAVHPNLDGGSKTGLSYFTVSAAGDMSAYPLGTSMFATSRVDAGAWSDTTTRRYQIDLLVSDITEPAGGGSDNVTGAYPAMSGGMQ